MTSIFHECLDRCSTDQRSWTQCSACGPTSLRFSHDTNIDRRNAERVDQRSFSAMFRLITPRPFVWFQADQIEKTFTPSVHRLMPHVPQKFYRIGHQQKLSELDDHHSGQPIVVFSVADLLLKLVKYDIEKKHPCLIFCNQMKTVQFLQSFFRDQRIEVLTLHRQMSDTVSRADLRSGTLASALIAFVETNKESGTLSNERKPRPVCHRHHLTRCGYALGRSSSRLLNVLGSLSRWNMSFNSIFLDSSPTTSIGLDVSGVSVRNVQAKCRVSSHGLTRSISPKRSK